MANMRAMATKDFCPPLSWFISLISLFLPVKLTAQDTPVAFSSLCAWSSSWGKHQIYCRSFIPHIFVRIIKNCPFDNIHFCLFHQILSDLLHKKTFICLTKQNCLFNQNFGVYIKYLTYIVIAVIPLDGEGTSAKRAKLLKDLLEVLWHLQKGY